jgi:hypothetical protein
MEKVLPLLMQRATLVDPKKTSQKNDAGSELMLGLFHSRCGHPRARDD